MTENGNDVTINKLDGKGALWTIAGTAIGGLATQWLNGIHGGGLGGAQSAVASAANTAVAIELAKKDSEIALLKANADTDKKLVDIFTALRAQDKAQDQALAAFKEETSLKFASVREDIHALDKRIGEVALVSSNGITQLSGAVAALQNAVAGITKTVVPITAVCPQPMPQYNSWTAPTQPTQAA